MEHLLKRADILWALFEVADFAFLSWYAFSVFPRRESAYYVDISNVNNDSAVAEEENTRFGRGNEDGDSSGMVIADESDEMQVDGSKDNATENNGNNDSRGQVTGNAETACEEYSEPAMISWNSGDRLPVPQSEWWHRKPSSNTDAHPARTSSRPEDGVSPA